jgi:hypothetical protein
MPGQELIEEVKKKGKPVTLSVERMLNRVLELVVGVGGVKPSVGSEDD